MHADGLNQNRAAIFIVARVVDELKVERVVDSAPRVQVVVALKYVFARIVKFAVAQQKAEAAKPQVFLMILFDGVRNEGHAKLVVRARPRSAGVVPAELEGLVDLGIGERLVLTFVPSNAAKGAHIT